MMTIRALPLPCVLIAGALGCGEDAGPVVAEPDIPLTAKTEEVFTLGDAHPEEEWQAFTEISEVHFDGAGNLILVDRRQGRIVVAGPDGQLRHHVSRRGDGPGELRIIGSVAVLRDNRLAVNDVGHNALLIFDENGNFLEQTAIGEPPRTLRSDGAATSTVVTSSIQSVATLSGSLPDGRLLLRRLQIRTFDIHTLGLGTEELYRAYEPPAGSPEQGGSVSIRLGDLEVPLPSGILPRELAFGPPLWGAALSDGRVAIVDSVGYRVKILQPNGSLDAALERSIEPLPVTPEMQEAARERQRGGAGTRAIVMGPGVSSSAGEGIASSLMEAMAPEMEFASEVPVIEGMAVDAEDRVWVTRSGMDGVSRGPTDVHTASGNYLGTLRADEFRIPDAFGPDGLMAYIETDELGIPFVRVLRLVNLVPSS